MKTMSSGATYHPATGGTELCTNQLGEKGRSRLSEHVFVIFGKIPDPDRPIGYTAPDRLPHLSTFFDLRLNFPRRFKKVLAFWSLAAKGGLHL